MRRYLGLALLVGCLCGLPAGAALSRQVVAYRIHAELDPQKKTVTGREALTWTNDSADAIGELQFHLYLNAFQNEKSSFMRESGGHLRGDTASKDSWGWCEVKRIRIAGGADLTPAIRYIHPDDNNADDRTVMALSLIHI